MKAGSYGTISVENDVIEKTIDRDKMNYAQKVFLEYCFAGKQEKEVMEQYYRLIKQSNINVVNTEIDVSGNTIKMRQPIISGMSLDYFIKEKSFYFNSSDFMECLEYLKQATKILVDSQKFHDFYIDCNLMNFIVQDKKLTLVDVFPPLIKQNLKYIQGSPVQQQVDLFVKPEIQFISMISYFMRPFYEDINNRILSENEKKKLSLAITNELIKKLEPITKKLFDIKKVVANIDEKSEHIFLKRFYEVKKYFRSKDMNFEDFVNNFSSYSLKRLLDSVEERKQNYECSLHQDIVDINIESYDKKLLNDLFIYFDNFAQFNEKSLYPTFTIKIEKQSEQNPEFLNKCFKTQESSSEPITYIDIDNQQKVIKIFLNENNPNNELVVRRNIYNMYARIMEESGYFTLHASCVEKNGKCFAIVGRKNAGKSVTMLNFLKNGYNLVSNDRIFLRSENGKLIAIGHPLSIGIRVTKKWFEDEQNSKMADYIKNSGFKFNFDLGDSDRNKFYFTPKRLVDLLDVELHSQEYLSGIIIPSYEPQRENFEKKYVSQGEVEELVLDQNIPALHETKLFLENIKIEDKLIPESKTEIAKELGQLTAVNICQNEKTSGKFQSFANDISM